MRYETDKLCVGYYTTGWTHWVYRTDHTIAQVERPNYFRDPGDDGDRDARRMPGGRGMSPRLGDAIEVVALGGSRPRICLYVVSSVSEKITRIDRAETLRRKKRLSGSSKGVT